MYVNEQEMSKIRLFLNNSFVKTDTNAIECKRTKNRLIGDGRRLMLPSCIIKYLNIITESINSANPHCPEVQSL